MKWRPFCPGGDELRGTDKCPVGLSIKPLNDDEVAIIDARGELYYPSQQVSVCYSRGPNDLANLADLLP